MIRINLLPEELRGRRSRQPAAPRQGPSILPILVVLVIIAADAALAWFVVDARMDAMRETERLQKEVQAKRSERDAKYDAFQELKILKDRLGNQIEVLQNLNPPDRILWSEKMNLLASIVHPDVFIIEMAVDEKVTEVETKDSQEARRQWEAAGSEGAEPPVRKVPLITQTLRIIGVATGENRREQFDNALRFGKDLQSFATTNEHGQTVRFTDGLRPGDWGGFISKDHFGKEVCEFTYTLTTVPQAGGRI